MNSFSKNTEKIKMNLPTWFKMKSKPNNIGLDFLNVFGLTLDDVENLLDSGYEQTRLETVDTSFANGIYKAILPSHINRNKISSVNVNGEVIFNTESLNELLSIQGKEYITGNNTYYFLDKIKGVVYLCHPFNADKTYKYGKIFVSVKEDNIIDEIVELIPHQVWNFIDEFGALLCCKRIANETNESYKSRLLDVFKNPANSTKKGLANGISRELDLRENLLWRDTSKEISLDSEMIILNSITVNEVNVKLEDIFINEKGLVVLKPNTNYPSYSIVSFIHGLEMNSLSDSKSPKFSNEIFESNGDTTDLMKYYINLIRENSSILWDDFKYDETLWITEDEEFENAFSFEPTFLDASIKGFAKLGFVK